MRLGSEINTEKLVRNSRIGFHLLLLLQFDIQNTKF